MRRLVTASLISLVAIAQIVTVSLAQDPSPSASAAAAAGGASPAAGAGGASPAAVASPMPYADYVAALKAFTTDDPFAGVSDPPTQDELVTAFQALVSRASLEQERLDAVVPEDCYADAHQELLAYWASSTDLTGKLATELAAGTTLDELAPLVNEMDAQLYERYPIAYVEATDGSGGFQGSPFNILDALSTCEVAAEASIAPEPMPAESPAS
jgi:hypothetical protein